MNAYLFTDYAAGFPPRYYYARGFLLGVVVCFLLAALWSVIRGPK
jgi:hypothetical protein